MKLVEFQLTPESLASTSFITVLASNIVSIEKPAKPSGKTRLRVGDQLYTIEEGYEVAKRRWERALRARLPAKPKPERRHSPTSEESFARSEVRRLLGEGVSRPQIAEALGITKQAVHYHVKAIREEAR